MAALPAIFTAASLIGTGVQAVGTLAAGRAKQNAAYSQAAQLEQKGKYEQAEAQVEGEQYKRNKKLALSKLQTQSAASGFSATDPTSLALADEITRYGTYQQQLAQYGGLRQRSSREAQAAASRRWGRAAMRGARYNAGATILGGISSIASRYNQPLELPSQGSYRYQPLRG